MILYACASHSHWINESKIYVNKTLIQIKLDGYNNFNNIPWMSIFNRVTRVLEIFKFKLLVV